jgi:hypothetical protein
MTLDISKMCFKRFMQLVTAFKKMLHKITTQRVIFKLREAIQPGSGLSRNRASNPGYNIHTRKEE